MSPSILKSSCRWWEIVKIPLGVYSSKTEILPKWKSHVFCRFYWWFKVIKIRPRVIVDEVSELLFFDDTEKDFPWRNIYKCIEDIKRAGVVVENVGDGSFHLHPGFLIDIRPKIDFPFILSHREESRRVSFIVAENLSVDNHLCFHSIYKDLDDVKAIAAIVSEDAFPNKFGMERHQLQEHLEISKIGIYITRELLLTLKLGLLF